MKICEVTIAKISPNFMRTINKNIQEVQKSPSRINPPHNKIVQGQRQRENQESN